MKTYQMNLRRYFTQLGIMRFIVAAALIAFAWFRLETIGAAIITVSVILILALIWIQYALTRLHIDQATLTQQGGFLPKKTLSLASLAPAVYAEQYVEPGFGIFKRLLLLDKATGKKLSISSLQWDEQAIIDIIQYLTNVGVQTHPIKDPTVTQQLRKVYPEYLSFSVRRPYVFATLFVLGMVVLIAVAVLVFQ